MSWDVYLVTQTEPTPLKCSGPEWNFSFNTHCMLKEAGLNPRQWHTRLAGHVATLIDNGIDKMKNDPERIRKHNPPGNWSSYEDLLGELDRMRECFRKQPWAVVRVF